MTSEEIQTPRLRLVVMEAELLRADAAGREAFGLALGADVPSTWPPENWEPHVFEFLAKQYAETPELIPWNRYVVLHLPEPVVVGNVNAFRRSAVEAEIGYGILPPWRRQGLGTEAVLAFVEELFRERALVRVLAHTFPALVASRRVLEKCGFLLDGDGDEEGTIRYCLERTVWEGRDKAAEAAFD